MTAEAGHRAVAPLFDTAVTTGIDSDNPAGGAHRLARPTVGGQWTALTGRTLRILARYGELVLAVIVPIVFGLSFYLPLKFVMQLGGLDYAQYLMPIIVLQSMAFAAISAAQSAAQESASGLTQRMQTMPVAAGVPLLARMTACSVRSVISVVASIVFGYAIGFRFSAGVAQALLFCAMALVISAVLCFGADAIGSLSKSPEATAQALTLPQLVLGMLSTGFVPEEDFPDWIQPFVRNQPISQFSQAMRAMTEDGVTWPVLMPSVLWLVGLGAVCIPAAVWANTRRG